MYFRWDDQYDPDPEPIVIPEPEPEWCDDDDIIAECANPYCGKEIRKDDEILTAMARDENGKLHPVCLCENCTKSMDFGTLLDLLGVWNDADRAEDTIRYAKKKAAELNRTESDRMVRVITTAATMKGARA